MRAGAFKSKSQPFSISDQENNVCTCECPDTQLETNHYGESTVFCYLFDLMTTSNSRVIVVNPYFTVYLQAAHAFPWSTGAGNSSSCSQLCCLLALSLQAKVMAVHLPPRHKNLSLYLKHMLALLQLSELSDTQWRMLPGGDSSSFLSQMEMPMCCLRGLLRGVTLRLCR